MKGDDATAALDQMPDMDVRSVAVIWSDGIPDVSWSGCSPYEAFALLRFGAKKIERDYAFVDDEDDDDD